MFMQSTVVLMSPEFSGHCILIFALIAFTVDRNLSGHEQCHKVTWQSTFYTRYSYDKVNGCINDCETRMTPLTQVTEAMTQRDWRKEIYERKLLLFNYVCMEYSNI